MKPKFTDKQISFMKAYAVNQNATQAAIEAGYSKRTARQQGQRLLSNVDIRSMIDRALMRVAERQQVRAEEVIEHMKLIAMSNIFDYISFDEEGTPHFDLGRVKKHLGVAIKSFDYYEIGEGAQRRRSVKIVFHDKLKALDKLGAATGAFRKHNKGIDEVRQNVVILVNTGIPGAPGSLVRRTEPNFATLPEKT